MSVLYVDRDTTQVNGSVTMTLSGKYAVGDFLLMSVSAYHGSTNTDPNISSGTGWTQLNSSFANGTFRSRIWYKFMSGTDTSVTISPGASTPNAECRVRITSFSGVNTTLPIHTFGPVGVNGLNSAHPAMNIMSAGVAPIHIAHARTSGTTTAAYSGGRTWVQRGTPPINGQYGNLWTYGPIETTGIDTIPAGVHSGTDAFTWPVYYSIALNAQPVAGIIISAGPSVITFSGVNPSIELVQQPAIQVSIGPGSQTFGGINSTIELIRQPPIEISSGPATQVWYGIGSSIELIVQPPIELQLPVARVDWFGRSLIIEYVSQPAIQPPLSVGSIQYVGNSLTLELPPPPPPIVISIGPALISLYGLAGTTQLTAPTPLKYVIQDVILPMAKSYVLYESRNISITKYRTYVHVDLQGGK